MKTKTLAILASLSFSGAAVNAQTAPADPDGVIAYSLPSTSVVIEVEAVQENFYAGPYARFAGKYLGIDVRQKDFQTYSVSDVKLTPYMEADPGKRYLMDTGGLPADASFLKLTSQGLVCCADGNFGKEVSWRFPSPSESDFSDKGLMSNISSEDATLYRNVRGESAYNTVAVRQEMLVEKSLEKRAAETAGMIFSLREKRLQIVTGDTDATYSGEAMGAAVAELTRLEKEYMTMFTGYSEYRRQKMTFEVVPQKGRENQLYVAFRLSDSAGLLSSDNISGKPVIMELVPQAPEIPAMTETKTSKAKDAVRIHYRVPAVCNVKLSDGMNVLFQGRIPVYQLGVESTFPLNIKVK